MKTNLNFLAIIIGIVLSLAWITSVYKCAATHQLDIMMMNFLFCPIGIIHGIGIWLHIW